jgi:tRNA (guanine37-N1)-methyltransferase
LVGSVRARTSPDAPGQWEIGRLMVSPDLQGQGTGRYLLEYAEQAAPAGTTRFWVNTGSRSTANLRRYRRAGYRPVPGPGRFPQTVDLVKPIS